MELPGRRKRVTERVHRCGEGGHEGGWDDRKGCNGLGDMEAQDPLW